MAVQALSSNNKDFPYEQVKELYIKNKEFFRDSDYPFEDFVKDSKGHLWAYIEDEKLIGYIFMHTFKDDSCCLSGNSNRKCFKYLEEIINGTCGYYFTHYEINKIYSITDYKHAQLVLKRAGFLQIDSDKFLKERGQ